MVSGGAKAVDTHMKGAQSEARAQRGKPGRNVWKQWQWLAVEGKPLDRVVEGCRRRRPLHRQLNTWR